MQLYPDNRLGKVPLSTAATVWAQQLLKAGHALLRVVQVYFYLGAICQQRQTCDSVQIQKDLHLSVALGHGLSVLCKHRSAFRFLYDAGHLNQLDLIGQRIESA